MVYENIAYPATYMTENFYYNWQISCYQDASTGEYCDLIIADWQNQTNTTSSNHSCADCILGPMKLQLESPLWTDEEWAEDFASLTSSCSATGYAWTSPTAYALNTSATATSTATLTGSASASSTSSTTTSSSTCTSMYTVQANDTCNSIAVAQNVSTYNFIVANNLNILCGNLPAVGEDVCIPEGCNSTTLLSGDTCLEMESNWNASLAQVLAWNPIFDSSCDNLYLFLGWQICSGPPGGWTIASKGAAATTTVAAVPTNAVTSSNKDCGEWYTVSSGDDCATITDNAGISLADFYFLNPQLNGTCTDLWLGNAYCVEAVGNIATYSGYSATTTQATTSYTRPVTTTTTWSAGPTYTLSSAPGTESDCVVYQDYYTNSSNGIANWGLRTDILDSLDLDLNNCSYYTSLYSVTISDIVGWNPSLSKDDCEFQPGYSYCILKSWNEADTDSSSNDTSTDCQTIDSSWIVNGTSSACNCYVAIYGYDNTTLTCDFFEYGSNNISESTLKALNPWIGTGNCTTGLFAGLASDSARAVCLGTNATESATSTYAYSSTPVPNTASATATSKSSPVSVAATASITMEPGYISTCDKYHKVVSGDSCYSISQAYGITLDEFYDWNPDVGDDCSSLWLGYGVCVGISSTTSSTASATSS
ncbi:hypothetical protein AbraIFM66951_000837 [Aspergillus brasiliensis]|nr:hypothetical protein AbraIFM66951_000837 [Aspergillus brasiliensis]